ncbi:unnamed protein product [Withania somnifera]
MGSAQAKPSMHSPPRGLEKLKLERGYIARGDQNVRPRRSIGQRPHEPREKNATGFGDGRRLSNANRETINGRKLVITSEGEKQTNENRDGGNVARTITKTTTVEEEELIDGWTKWLVDNIPREVLAGLVGSGTYSNVYRVRDRVTGKIVALKKVRFDTSEPESVKFMAREIMILQKMDHTNIIKLEGLATSRMQYNLTSIISRPYLRLNEAQIKCYMQQLLAGLQHCHERGILHRDIKGSNLLIDKNGMLKIADFGLANFFNPEKKRPLTSRVVTLWYRAPELLLGATDYGIGVDLWSAGCLMAEMFAGRPILPGRTEVEQLHKIFKLCGTPTDDYWRKAKLSTTFRPPYTYRSNKKEAFRHFPVSCWRLLNVLLSLDPANRGSAGSALEDEFFLTSPLACQLLEPLVVYKEDPEETKPDHGSSNEPTRACEVAKHHHYYYYKRITSKPTMKVESPPRSTESHSTTTRNIKHRPPSRIAKKNNKNNNIKKDPMNRFSRVQRAQSKERFPRY